MGIPDSEYPLGRRITVNGKGGKTTLSKALALRFGLEFIEQDSIRHQANWVELTGEQHRKVLSDRLSQATGGWVSDGNYSAVRDLVMAEADTAVVLALPLRVMMWRTFTRTVRRCVRREVLWNGNKEGFWTSFFTRQSVIYDIWIRRDRFRAVAEMAEAESHEHVRLVILRSTKELDAFYEEYGLVRG